MNNLDLELYLRHRDYIAYPLRKLINSLGLGLRYDNSVKFQLGLVFKKPATARDLRAIYNYLVARGFQPDQVAEGVLFVSFFEADRKCHIKVEISTDRLHFSENY